MLKTVELVLALMSKLNLGVDEAIKFYNLVRTNNPDLPEKTDAEIIDIMTNKFQSEADLSRAAQEALRSTE